MFCSVVAFKEDSWKSEHLFAIFWCLETKIVTRAWWIWSLVSERHNCKRSLWTEKHELGRHNRIDCTFIKWSCNPVCREKENGSCGLNSTESQQLTQYSISDILSLRLKAHWVWQFNYPLNPGTTLLPRPSSTPELKSNGRTARTATLYMACKHLKSLRLKGTRIPDPLWLLLPFPNKINRIQYRGFKYLTK